MKYEIPERDASKQRLKAELSWEQQLMVDDIMSFSESWEEAQKQIVAYLGLEVIRCKDSNERIKINNIRTLYKSKWPVGAQRKIARA